jgi:hypothetical protein
MIGSKWDGHQLAIGDSTHRPVPTWCGFFALVLGPIWLAYNRHSSGSGTWMLLGSASSKKALLVYLLCHGCARGVLLMLWAIRSCKEHWRWIFTRPQGNWCCQQQWWWLWHTLPSRIWRMGWKHTSSKTQMPYFVCSSCCRLYDGKK